MLVRGHKSQFNVVGSQFARKKQTLYISLTLKECIKLLPNFIMVNGPLKIKHFKNFCE